jgi:hypothetical protein
MNLISISFGDRVVATNCCAAQAITELQRCTLSPFLNETLFLVLIVANAAYIGRIASKMPQRLEIPHRIIDTSLQVRAHRFVIIGMIQPGVKAVEGVRCGGRIRLSSNLV